MAQMLLPGMSGMPRAKSQFSPVAAPEPEKPSEGFQPTLSREWQLMGATKKVAGMPWTPEWRQQTINSLKDAAVEDGPNPEAFTSIHAIFHGRSRVADNDSAYDRIDRALTRSGKHMNEDWADMPEQNIKTRHVAFTQGWVRAKDVLYNMGETGDYRPDVMDEDDSVSGDSAKEKEGSRLPRFMRSSGGDNYLIDGHHRSVAHLINGDQTMSARYIRER